MSRMGYVIMYAGCPVFWWSRLKTEITLSTTEAKYIKFIHAMREVIPLMEFIKEEYFIFDINLPKP